MSDPSSTRLAKRRRPPGLERRPVVGWVLELVERADGVPLTPPMRPGLLLGTYDPEAHAGRGDAVWTGDSRAALVFDSRLAAIEVWLAVPRACPLRPDGELNRPLTAFTVEVREVLG